MKILCLNIFFLIGVLSADDAIFYSVSCSGSLSHTGYAIIPSADLNWKSHTLYLGPKLPVSGNYIAFDQSYGLDIGYKFNFVKQFYKKNINFFILLDYQLFSYQQKNRFTNSNHNNHIYEIQLGYGIQFQIYDKFYLGNSIAIGKYWESYFNNYKHSRIIFDGYDNNIKIFFTYFFYEI